MLFIKLMTEKYCKIAGGTNKYTKIINNKATNDVKVLFVGNYDKGVQKLINNYNPDLVIYLTEIFEEDNYKKLFK